MFSPDGSLGITFGSRGSGDGQLLRPAGVVVAPDGTVFVADQFNDRIEKFGSDGRFLSYVGADAQVRRPEGLALDRDGNLWVADYGRDRIVKVGTDGHLVSTLGSHGSGVGEFSGPKGVAVDGAGRVFVADTGNARVQRFAADGTPDLQWSLPSPQAATS